MRVPRSASGGPANGFPGHRPERRGTGLEAVTTGHPERPNRCPKPECDACIAAAAELVMQALHAHGSGDCARIVSAHRRIRTYFDPRVRRWALVTLTDILDDIRRRPA